MIIGIDGNEANVKNKVGISEYAYELLQQFKDFPSTDQKFEIYLKNKPREDLPQEKENWHYKLIGPKRLWTQFALPKYLYITKTKPDVFFSPTHYAPRFCPVPTAIAIMDLSYVHFPQLFKKTDLYKLKNWTEYSAKKAKAIFTISLASKNDILNEYHIDENKIHVTYPGIKQDAIMQDSVSIEQLRKKYLLQNEYILFVGTLQPRKNIVRLIEAFAKVYKELKKNELQLLIVGKKGWLFEDILHAPIKYKIEKNVQFLEFVSNEELDVLYKNALCFILPSLYEGFGLPVLEAMKNGCPVITSNVSSLPEAGGDAAVYVDPENVGDIAGKLGLVIRSKDKRLEMIKKGYEQVKKFSWEKTANQTIAILEKIAQK